MAFSIEIFLLFNFLTESNTKKTLKKNKSGNDKKKFNCIKLIGNLVNTWNKVSFNCHCCFVNDDKLKYLLWIFALNYDWLCCLFYDIKLTTNETIKFNYFISFLMLVSGLLSAFDTTVCENIWSNI